MLIKIAILLLSKNRFCGELYDTSCSISANWTCINNVCNPTVSPTAAPSVSPTGTANPTMNPTEDPTQKPSAFPSSEPSNEPTIRPSNEPSTFPTIEPTTEPTVEPSQQPTGSPSKQPTQQPTSHPSHGPTMEPTAQPTLLPSTWALSDPPSMYPTLHPSHSPSVQPTLMPTTVLTAIPNIEPTTTTTARPTDPKNVNYVTSISVASTTEIVECTGWALVLSMTVHNTTSDSLNIDMSSLFLRTFRFIIELSIPWNDSWCVTVNVEYNVSASAQTRRRLMTISTSRIDATFSFNDASNSNYFDEYYNATTFALEFEYILSKTLNLSVTDVITSEDTFQIVDSEIIFAETFSADTNRPTLIIAICFSAVFIFCCVACSACVLWVKYERDSMERWHIFLQRHGLDRLSFSALPRISRASTLSPSIKSKSNNAESGEDSEADGDIHSNQGVSQTYSMEDEKETEAGGGTLCVDEVRRKSSFAMHLEMHMDQEEPIMANVLQEMHSESLSPRDFDDDENVHLKAGHQQAVPSQSFG